MNTIIRTIIVALSFLFTTAMFSQNEPVYNDAQQDAFEQLSYYNSKLDLIVFEFAKDIERHFGIVIENTDVFNVKAMDYQILVDNGWKENTKQNILGMAIGMFDADEILVVINDRIITEYTDTQLKMVVYHELMHDVFDYEHEDTDHMLMSKSITKHATNEMFVEFMIEQAFEIIKSR